MSKEKVYYFPPLKGKEYKNPYSANYRNSLAKRYDVVNIKGAPSVGMSIAFILSVFRADIYVINWLENIGKYKFGSLQFELVKLGLWIIKKRKARIVWMFHNKHPHGGHDKCSKWLHDYMFRNASLIISHSKEATEYAKNRTSIKVIYVCHPIHPIKMKSWEGEAKNSDVFIWGNIFGYKGVYEFLQEEAKRHTDLIIRIIGKAENKKLADEIKSMCRDNIIFENRRAEFGEIEAYIRKSRYVLFPYIGSCVSSSGALIDTLVMGGTPVGPEIGAFKDLSDEGVCRIYKDYNDLFDLLNKDYSIKDETRQTFINGNSWDNLIDIIVNNLEPLIPTPRC